jgi:hypothetical protein
MGKEEKIPMIDPATPNVYAKILRTAAEIRERRQKQNGSIRSAMQYADKMNMRTIVREFDCEIDRKFVQKQLELRAKKQKLKINSSDDQQQPLISSHDILLDIFTDSGNM